MKQKKLNILKQILGAPKKQSSSEYLFQCPYCNHHKKKLAINLDKGWHCWVCDTKGKNIFRIIRKFGNHNHKSAWLNLVSEVDYSKLEDFFNPKQKEIQKIDLPEGFRSLANKDIPPTGFAARNYLKKRGLTKQDLVWWKIGYCSTGDYKGRVIIPSFDIDGNLNYFISRSYNYETYPKYKNPPAGRNIIFNDLFVDWTSNIILVEGIFDAIVAGRNAVPLLGSTFNKNSKLLEKIVKTDAGVYVALDSDAKKKELEIIKTLLDFDIEVWKIDIGNHEDAGSMTKEEFQEKLTQAVLINPDNYLMLTLAMSV